MSGMQRWAIVSELEHEQLAGEIHAIADRWQGAPTPWKDHWDHLVAAAERWDQNPEGMQLLLDAIARDYERTGTTDLADPIQVRNLILAGELVEARRTDLATLYSPTAPDRVDIAFRYLTSFRAAGNITAWQSLPSWSTARRWLTGQAAATAADTVVDVTITGPDPFSGAPARPLMTGTGLSAAELGDQLRHLDELLGAASVPVDAPAQTWLDDLRYDVLCDAYRDTLIDHANPWAVSRRFENYLRADDLYAEIVDYADRAGLHRAASDPDHGTDQPDVVASHLADIQDGVRRSNVDWTTPPRTNTWLDEAVDNAQQRLDVVACGGLRLMYAIPAEAGRVVEVGFDQDRWYLQYVQSSNDGTTVIRDTPPESFSSCDELIDRTALFASSPAQDRPQHAASSQSVAGQLRAFEAELSQLQHDVSTLRQLRDAIRAGKPLLLRKHQPPTHRTQRPTNGAMSRDPNWMGRTEAPDSTPPTPPGQRPRAKRRRPPDPGGPTHSRRL